MACEATRKPVQSAGWVRDGAGLFQIRNNRGRLIASGDAPLVAPAEAARELAAEWGAEWTVEPFPGGDHVHAVLPHCRHCPDGHGDPWTYPWSVRVAPEVDGDGQPTHLRVEKADGAHVAELDAEWLRKVIRDAEAWRHYLRQRAGGA